MRPLRLRMQGITRFTRPVDLDLASLPPGLVAVVGPNGAGKSTIMECLAPAALYRNLPSRGGLLASASARDATLDLDLEYQGRSYRLLHHLDPDHGGGRGKSEAFLYLDGEALTPGRVTDFDEAVAKHFPSPAAMLSSVFGAQNRAGNFLELSTADRRELFAELLGLGRLVQLHERAREHRKHLDAIGVEVDRAVAELADAKIAEDAAHSERNVAVEQLRTLLEEEQMFAGAVDEAAAKLASARADLEVARKAVDEAQRRRGLAAARMRQLTERRDQSTRAAAPLRDLLARADEIRARAEKLVHLEQERASAMSEYQRTTGEHKAAQESLVRAHRELTTLRGKVFELDTLLTDLDRVASTIPTLEKAAKEHAEHMEQSRALIAARDEIGARLVAVSRDLNLARVDADLLVSVPCGGSLVRRADDTEADCSTCHLLGRAVDARERVPGLEAELVQAEADRSAADRALETARDAMVLIKTYTASILDLDGKMTGGAVYAVQLATARAKIERREAYVTQREAAALEEAEAALRVPGLEEDAARKLQAQRDVAARGLTLRTEIDALAGAAGRAEMLQRAEASLPLLERSIADDTRDMGELAEEIASIVVPTVDSAVVTAVTEAEAVLQRHRGHLRSAQDAVRETRERISRAEGRLQAIGNVAERGKMLEAKKRDAGLRKIGWALVERGLGPEGVQALEIDAAGPEVSRLTNALLEACYGSRFTVELRTVRPAEGAKKQREVFDVVVYDGLRGGDARGHADLSGGERVVVDEALKLGLALFNAERTGSAFEVLWRDECDGAMDPDNASRYPDMLRRALQLGGLRNVYYVSHRPEVAGQADARIVVTAGGEVRLE
jgi:exonuclease SbcC